MKRMDNDTPNIQQRTTCIEHDLVGPSSEDKNDASEYPPVQHQEDMFGPWLVVTRKRKGNKSPKKEIAHVKIEEP